MVFVFLFHFGFNYQNPIFIEKWLAQHVKSHCGSVAINVLRSNPHWPNVYSFHYFIFFVTFKILEQFISELNVVMVWAMSDITDVFVAKSALVIIPIVKNHAKIFSIGWQLI
jgi:hypothetical protein